MRTRTLADEAQAARRLGSEEVPSRDVAGHRTLGADYDYGNFGFVGTVSGDPTKT